MSDEKNPAVEVEQLPVNQAHLAAFEEMTKAGVLYGRRHSKSNPKMKPYVYGVRGGFDVVDLNATMAGIEAAEQFLKEVVKKGQSLLVVATGPAGAAATKSFVEKYTLPSVTDRWLGGTLSNFEIISKRISHLTSRKADKAAGRLDKYTKKERVVIDKEIERLTKLFGGIEVMTMLPGALLVVDAPRHMTAIREAKRMRIPVIAIANTDTNPDLIDYLIPANDNSVSGVSFIVSKLEQAIVAGIKERAAATPVAVKAKA